MKHTILLLLLILLFASCNRNNTFRNRIFTVDEATLQSAIDSLYDKHPPYRSPKKWTLYNSFAENGISFPGERRFYFSVPPEEMYYVTILSVDGGAKMVISAVHTNNGWQLAKDISSSEVKRIENRFDKKIISKLEILTNSTCTRED